MVAMENGVLAVVDAADGRQTLRNICITYDDTVVDRFGRAALFEPTELGAFLAFRLQAKHGDVRIHRTRAVDERRNAYRRVHDAAVAYEKRSHKHTPYRKFAAGTEYPLPEEMDERLAGIEPTIDPAPETESTDRTESDRLVGRRSE